MLFEHKGVPASASHRLLQAPQFLESDRMSTHRAAQSLQPLGHPHTPLSQTYPALSLQIVVHDPQCFGSVVTSTQVPLQFSVLAAVQESTH